MAIPDNYIDKITKGNDSRMISPAADMVRVDNDNFEGETLDEVLDDVAQAIGEAGEVKSVTINETNHTPDSSGVIDLGTVITAHQDISGKANTADLATVATSGSYNDLSNKPTIPDTSTLATKTELNAKQDKINDLAAIRSGAALGATSVQTISVNGGTAQQPTNGVINLTVATGGDNDLVDLSDGTENDGAVVFTKRNGDTITLDLNHVHPQYLKYELLADEAAYTALATKDSGTLYLIPES